MNLGVVRLAQTADEKVRELQRFLRIANLATLERGDFLVPSLDGTEGADYFRNANAWVQTALSLENGIEVERFNMRKLKETLPEVRRMTERMPKEAYPELKERMAACGVAFVMLPKLGDCDICGMVKWEDREKVIMAVNEKNEYRDQSWFSIFYELGNILQKKIAMLLVNDEKQRLVKTSNLRMEVDEKANEFACDILISQEQFYSFIEKNRFDESSVTEFANKTGIDPGIVVGRLQRERLISYQTALNALRQRNES